MLSSLESTECVAVVPSAGFPQRVLDTQTAIDTVTSGCPECTATSVPVQIADLGSPAMSQTIVSALQANPKINYVAVTVGNLAAGLDAALKQAGLSDKVKIIGAVPDPSAFEALNAGTNAMWVNYSPVMNSWALLDAALRSLDAQGPVSGLPFPVSVITKAELPTDYSGGAVVYPENYQDLFGELWLVK